MSTPTFVHRRAKAPAWRGRSCAYCSNYATTICHAWTGGAALGAFASPTDALCQRPLCDAHTIKRGQVHLCREHGTPKQSQK